MRQKASENTIFCEWVSLVGQGGGRGGGEMFGKFSECPGSLPLGSSRPPPLSCAHLVQVSVPAWRMEGGHSLSV